MPHTLVKVSRTTSPRPTLVASCPKSSAPIGYGTVLLFSGKTFSRANVHDVHHRHNRTVSLLSHIARHWRHKSRPTAEPSFFYFPSLCTPGAQVTISPVAAPALIDELQSTSAECPCSMSRQFELGWEPSPGGSCATRLHKQTSSQLLRLRVINGCPLTSFANTIRFLFAIIVAAYRKSREIFGGAHARDAHCFH